MKFISSKYCQKSAEFLIDIIKFQTTNVKWNHNLERRVYLSLIYYMHIDDEHFICLQC